MSKSGTREFIGTPSTRPRKMPRTECSDTPDDVPLDGDPTPQSTHSFVSLVSVFIYVSVEGMAPPVRTLPRAKTTWRVVEPPRRVVGPTGPFPTQDLRPRVWAGVRWRPPRRKSSGVDLLCDRVKMSCLLRSPPLQKIMAALLGKIYALHSFFLRRNVTPASGGGRMMSGRAGESPSRCKHSIKLPASKLFPGRRGSS
jgi:hypothetical protein